MTTRSVPTAVFHAVLRCCLAQQRRPTHAEVDLVAAKIWNEGFEAKTGLLWPDVPNATHRRIIKAASGALGFLDFAAG
jgi:hypothetical protein